MLYKSLFAIAALLTCVSCGNNSNSSNPNGSTDTTSRAPVETEKPNTNYKPAFVGQTRIASVHTTAPYQVTEMTNKLDKPWGIGILPDGKFLITEKPGKMRIVSADGTLGPDIKNVPAVDDDGQGGLLGIAIDPDFANNRLLFWAYTEDVGSGNHTSFAKGNLSADESALENVTVIYRATPAYDGDKHFGGRIVITKDGNLFASTGERSDLETRPQAQELNSALGKILHITKDGKPVAGNPFMDSSNARPEIYSYGHRNVLGMALDPVTGNLWNSEMGPRGGDEINIVKAGANYGWPTITYGIEYSGKTIGEGINKQAGMEQPVYYWDPVLSPGGMIFYTGDQMTEWKNNLFLCGLSSQHIARLVIEDNKVVGEERLLADKNERFRDIAQGTDGALYAVTDGGKMYKIFAGNK